MYPQKEISILIAEQHDLIIHAYEAMIERESNMTLIGTVRSGRDAVDQARQLSPDVLVMDINLPVLDGIAATRLIKAGQPDVRVLIVTADDSDEVVFAALAAGADGYCLKNIRLRQLANAIATVHCGAAWLDQRVAHRVFNEALRTRPSGVSDQFGLTGRQLEVLKMIVEGKSNQQIALQLGISIETVKSHVRVIMDKLMVSDRTQAAVQAFRAGIGN